MNRSRLFCAALAAAVSLIFTASVEAQPTIAEGGVVNAASLQPGPLSPGQMVAIQGEGLGPEEPVAGVADGDGLLPTTLAGVQAMIGGQAAPLLMAGEKEVRAQAPYELDPGAVVEIQVIFDGAASNVVEAEVAVVTPEIFREQSGRPVAATVRPDGTLVLPGRPVEPGGRLMLFATGGGHTEPPSDTGRVARPPYPTPSERVTLRIGGVVAELEYAGSAPGYAGLLQLNTIVPESVAPAAADTAGEEMEQNLVPVDLSVGQGRSETVFLPIDLPGVNNPPHAMDDQAETQENESVLIDVLANDSDVDDDALSVKEAGDGEHGETTVEGDAVRYTPEAGFSGLDSFEYAAADPNGGSATAKVTVAVNPSDDGENAPPTARGVDTTVISGRNKRIQLRARDDDGDVLEFSILEGPSNGSLGEIVPVNAGLAEVVYSPVEDFEGFDGFEFGADDGQGGSTQASVVIEVLPEPPGPQLSEGVADEATTPEDVPVLVDVLSNDKLGDTGEALMLGEISNVQNGETAVSDEGVTFTPDENYHGPAGFSYLLKDALGLVGVIDVSVEVTPVNDQPRIVERSPNNISVPAGSENVYVEVLVSDPDHDEGELTVTATSTNQAVLKDSAITRLEGCEAGHWVFELDLTESAAGFGGLRIQVEDPEGGNYAEIVDIEVTNGAPEIGPAEDVTVVVNHEWTRDVVIEDAETSAQHLLVAVQSSDGEVVDDHCGLQIQHLSGDTFRISGYGDGIGTTTITITAEDEGKLTDQATFMVTVTEPPNADPVVSPIADQDATTGVPFQFDFTATDEETASGALTPSAANLDSGIVTITNLSAVHVSGSTFRVTGTAQNAGAVVLRIAVEDEGGKQGSQSVNLTVVDPPANTPPEITPALGVNVGLNSPWTRDVVIEDSETSAQHLLVEVQSSDDGVVHGQCGLQVQHLSGDTFRVSGYGDGIGTTTITITAEDEGGLTDQGTFTVTVGSSCAPPLDGAGVCVQ